MGAAIAAAGIGAAGSIIGGSGGSMFGGSNKWITPGLTNRRSHDESMAANNRYNEALHQYLQAMTVLGTGARRTGDEMMRTFQSGASNIRGQGERATREVQDIYKDFGREAEGVSREEYERLLANIEDQSAISRARGGYNSGQDMIAAGQKGEAMHGLNRSLADIAGQRAKLLGDATERGRSSQISNEMSLLGQGLGVRERQFTLPASFAKTRTDNQFNARTSNTALYPERNLHLLFGGGSAAPQATGLEELGGTLSAMGGTMFANAQPLSELEKAQMEFYKSQTK